jgi:Putative neutral zinc metallopeptidase
MIAVALAGCGSSSSSSTTKSSTTHTSPATKPTATSVKPLLGGAAGHAVINASPRALKVLAKVPKASGFAPHIAGLSTLPLPQQLTALDNDINTFWTKEFASSNVKWPQAQQVLITTQTYKTGCSVRPTIGPNDPWFLCDPVFFWPLPWIQQNIANKGDVNLAFSVGEMWGFHVQNVLGFTQQLEKGSMSKGAWAAQTLCLTGLWVRTLSQRNLFQQGDTQAASSFLAALSDVSGITAPDISNQALQQAFFAGYHSGDPATCGASSGGGSQTTSSTATGTTTSQGLTATTS